MTAVGLLVVMCGLSGRAIAGPLGDPPAPLALTDKEQATLDARDVVVKTEEAEDGTETLAVIDVLAPPATAFSAVLDLPARAAEVGSIRAVEVYGERPATEGRAEQLGGRWELGVMGKTVIFHTLYDLDRADTWCRYVLDSDKENDIAYVRGSYQVYAHGEGSRLVYRSVTDTGYTVPGWLRRWLTSGSLKEQMIGMRTRAEAG